jgi:glycosyltransferase involved in cell wall biosynthesis
VRAKKHSIARRAFRSTRSFLRLFQTESVPAPVEKKPHIKVAFIHNEKKLSTGASHINQLMSVALSRAGVLVRHFYPRVPLTDTPVHLKGIANILYFYSLLEYKDRILQYDIIQGTTYTPLPFVPFTVPTVCHFGSTSRGFLDRVPRTSDLPQSQKSLYRALARDGIIPEFEFKTLRPIQDVADIEEVTATGASACIATSEKVKKELMQAGVAADRIHIVYNAIEDYWFKLAQRPVQGPPHIVYLGRIGGEVFTLKLKGFSRLVAVYRAFPHIPKTTICMTTNKKLKDWMRVAFPKHHMFVNLRKDFIPGALAGRRGGILILPSRYEGFSLSLIEGMSQGLVPVSFDVGVASEVIRDGENGFLVSSEAEAIARIRELLRDDDRRLRMAEAAAESVQKFRSSVIAEDLLQTYRKIRARHRAERRPKVGVPEGEVADGSDFSAAT